MYVYIMDSVAKQYNLPPELVGKINEYRRELFAQEHIEPFRKVSIYARNIRISPDKYLSRPKSQMLLFYGDMIEHIRINKLTFAMFSRDKRNGTTVSRVIALYTQPPHGLTPRQVIDIIKMRY